MQDTWSALADPTRRQILKLLRKKNMTAGEIADQFQITKPSISHHLAILKGAGLVEAMRKGQQIEYAINTTVFQDLLEFFSELAQRGGENV